MKRIIALLLPTLLVLFLVACDKYYVKITGPDSLEVGETVQFEIDTNYKNPTVYWSVSDSSLASVDDDGNVTGVAAGTVTVYVEVENVGMAEKEVEVITPALPAYTPAQLKPILKDLFDTYAEAEHGHVKIETNLGETEVTTELIYNFSGEAIESLMYKLSGAESAHVYIKDGFAYMYIDEAKSKAQVTEIEAYTIINSYGFATFAAGACAFYNEDAFFTALSSPVKADDTLTYQLDLSAYNGSVFDTTGKDEITLAVQFANGQPVKVTIEITADETVDKVIVHYLGTTAKTIEYPTDLDTYPFE